MNTALDIEIRLKLLKLLKDEPKLTQREMKEKMGVSLGKTNYCLSVLVEKGMIKVETFKKHKSRSTYMYRLTPKGFKELASLTLDFLKYKLLEYNRVKQEIKLLSEQIDKMDPVVYDDPDLIGDLKKDDLKKLI